MTRLVLVSELYVIVTRFNTGITIDTTLNSILRGLVKGDIPIVVYTDFYSLYDYIIRLNSTDEKWLIIDLIGL